MSSLRKPVPAIASAAALGDLLRQIFVGENIRLPPHTEPLLHLHAALPDQRPATCGAYVLTYVLPARGFTELEGQPLGAEDYMAHLARVTITAREDPATYRFPVDVSGPVTAGHQPRRRGACCRHRVRRAIGHDTGAGQGRLR